jgi:hypothetical protein
LPIHNRSLTRYVAISLLALCKGNFNAAAQAAWRDQDGHGSSRNIGVIAQATHVIASLAAMFEHSDDVFWRSKYSCALSLLPSARFCMIP